MKSLTLPFYLTGWLVLLGILVLTPCTPPRRTTGGASLHIYDLSIGQQVAELKGHNRPTTAIAVSTDGTLVLTASLTSELRLWSLEERRELRSIELAPGPGAYLGSGYSMHFLDGTNAALVGHDRAGINLWNLDTGQKIRSLHAPFREAQAVVVSPAEQTVTATSVSDAITVTWGVADGVPRGVLVEEWLENTPWVTLARDGRPRSWWNADTGERWPEGKPSPEGKHVPSRHQSTLSPDGRKLLTYYGGVENQPDVHRFQVWDLDTGNLLCQRSGITLPIVHLRSRSGCESFAFSPNSQLLAVGLRTGRIEIREVASGRLRQELSVPLNSCGRVVFLPDGKRLLTWGAGIARLWDLERVRLVRSLGVRVLTCLAFTPDGRYLLVGGVGEFSGL